MEVRALLKHTRTTPQKARLVANLIRGKNVNDAINILAFTRKRAAEKFQKLLTYQMILPEIQALHLHVFQLYLVKIQLV